MGSFKLKLRSYIKKIYHKLNPQYKYILQMNDEMHILSRRIDELKQMNLAKCEESDINIDKFLLGTDSKNVRYLYLLRYIRESDRVLDIEGEFGAGVELLSKYTPADYCDCVNSISFYTEIAKMYFSSENVKFHTGNWSDLENKYNVITFFDERKTSCLNDKDIIELYEKLEFGGILAIAVFDDIRLEKFEKNGFIIEKKLYQNIGCGELMEKREDNNSNIIVAYLKKDE